MDLNDREEAFLVGGVFGMGFITCILFASMELARVLGWMAYDGWWKTMDFVAPEISLVLNLAGFVVVCLLAVRVYEELTDESLSTRVDA